MGRKIELKQRDIIFTFLISGLAGFFIGLLYSVYQTAVIDHAQVLAGIVKYPHSNPFYLVSVKGWTILTQLTALFLRLGIHEQALSFFWSGVMGMVSFQALALSMLALTSNIKFSVLSSFFIFFIHGVWLKGFNYPLSLLGSESTFGTMSLTFPLLVIALIALGQYRLGGLLLGLAPAVHPSLGAFFNLIIIASLMWHFRAEGKFPKRFLKYLILGYVITGTSLVYQLSLYRLPNIDPVKLAEYKYVLIVYWSEHLKKFSWFSGGMARVALSLALSIWGLSLVKRLVSCGALFILRTFIVSGIIATGLSLVYWLPPGIIVDKFYNLMMAQPARIFNYNLLGAMVLVLGLLWHFKDRYWVKLNLTALITLLACYKIIYKRLPYHALYEMPTDYFTVFLLFASGAALILSFMPQEKSAWLKLNISAMAILAFYSFTPVLEGSSFVALAVIFVLTIVLALSVISLGRAENMNHGRRFFFAEGLSLGILGLLWIFTKSENPVYFGKYSLARLCGISYIYAAAVIILILPYLKPPGFIAKISRLFKKLHFAYLDGIIYLVLAGVFLLTLTQAGYSFRKHIQAYDDNQRFYAELSNGAGMVLAGPGASGFIAFRSRRALLYYGTPNNLIYSIESAPEFNRIFRIVYGVDLLSPPEESLNTGLNLPREGVRSLWEARSLAQWKEIKNEFNVSEVVTLADWKLKLPQAMRDDKFALYKIP